jgi:epoxyqueuosine reductase QueG
MDLTDPLRQLVNSYEIDHFGISSLESAKDFIIDQGGDIVSPYTHAVTIGIILPHEVVNLIPQRSRYDVRVSYRHHAYDVINARLDNVASLISTAIQRQGYKSFPIPASKQIDDNCICGTFSHKLGAHLSGIGWIGKSCLLITPKNGPRVRWASILTDIPLETTGSQMEQQCGSCTECVDICPVNAFTGRAFSVNEPRSARYDAKKCYQYFESMKNDKEPAVCGLCLFVCPFGRK